MKKYYPLFITLILFLILQGCRTFAPHTSTYQPLDWEKEIFDSSVKSIMPSDLIESDKNYLGKTLHWVGIVDTFIVLNNSRDNPVAIKIYFDQKYYDYLEDYSIQDEIIFLSPKGEGKFAIMERFVDVPIDSLIEPLNFLIEDKSLGFCYGIYSGNENGIPVLENSIVRYVPYHFYSTKILSYEVKRDSNGVVVANDRGFPVLENFEILRVPGHGQNK